MMLNRFLAVLFVSTLALGQGKATDPAGGGESLAGLAKQKPTVNGPAPRTAGGKPDLSGLWGPDRNFIYDISSALKPGETLPIQQWAAKLAQERVSKFPAWRPTRGRSCRRHR
jgi:hypothetical protein